MLQADPPLTLQVGKTSFIPPLRIRVKGKMEHFDNKYTKFKITCVKVDKSR